MRNRRSKHTKKTYGIIGLGRFGHALATSLAEQGCDLIVLDIDEDKVREMREYTENAFVVANLDKKTLMDTGIQNCDVAVVCIGSQIDVSVLTTLNLISMNVPTVIAKATSTEHGAVIEKLGAEVVYPEKDMGVRLANRLENSGMLDFVQLSEKINVTKMLASKKMIGKSIAELEIRQKFGLNIIGIENKGNLVEIIRPDYIFREEDILFLAGTKDGIESFGDWMEE